MITKISAKRSALICSYVTKNVLKEKVIFVTGPGEEFLRLHPPIF